MTTQLESSIVRIHTTYGTIVGAGFLITNRQVLTCVHVVTSALGLPGEAEETPEGKVYLDFPLVAPGHTLMAQVVIWQPEEDIAGLELDQEPPSGVQPAQLAAAEDLWGHPFRVFGFPLAYKDGVWASGVLRARNAAGWVQIEDVKRTGYFVQPGFSGAPVWDEELNRVVGMVVAADMEPGVRAAFLIPADVVVRVCPELECILQKPVVPLGKLSNVPSLPPHFLSRPEDLDSVKEVLLADMGESVVSTGAARKVGMHGMVGIGKSVLAAALARDSDVRRAFPDGVLWVTVGREPLLILRQWQLVEVLGGMTHPPIVDTQMGKARLSELLTDKDCLLVLDDVWDVRHVEAFDALGPRCRMLLTTRDASLITALGAAAHTLDVLDKNQSLQLLARWAGQDVETLPSKGHEVAKECGRLPLALAMVGAMVRGKPNRWDNVLYKLRNADLEKIQQQFPNYPYPSLLRAIQVSVEDLEPKTQARYLDLAVFPDDTSIPEAVLTTFWALEGISEYDAQDAVDVLVNRSLVRRDEEGRLTLHDLQHDYVRKQVENLPVLHNRLLRAYATRCPDGWHTGPDDGYFFEHLVYHLVEAGREVDEILNLVKNPIWQRARRREDVAGSGMAQDVEWLCSAAEKRGLSTLTQYVAASLLKARLRSQVTNLPVEAVETFARLGHFDQALTLTELMVSEASRVAALRRLGQWCLGEGDVETAVELIKRVRAGVLAFEKDEKRPRHLARLASHFTQANQLDEAQRSLDLAFELVGASEDEVKQGLALAALVQGMYDYDMTMLQTCLARAEAMARQIERVHSYRALALARIAEQMHRIDAGHTRTLVKEALSILISAPPSYVGEGEPGIAFSQRDHFLATTIRIAVQIGLENQALELLQTIKDSATRAIAHIELARVYLDRQSTEKVKCYLRQALAIAETELEGVARDSLRRQLVNLFLQVSEMDQAQEVATSIQDQSERVNGFCAIVEHLSRNGKVGDAHDWVEQIGVDWGKAFGKAAIAAGLIGSDPDNALTELKEALTLANQIREGIVGSRHDVYVFIAKCISHLSPTRPRQAKELLEQAVTDLQAEAGRDSMEIYAVTRARDEALSCLVEALAAFGYYAEGASISRDIASEYARDHALLLCIRAACTVGDWDAADTLQSEVTSDCWGLICRAAREGWQAKTTQALDEIVKIVEEGVSEACNWLPCPNDALGDVAPELGISGHITAAQTLWAKMDNPIERHESQVDLVRLLTQAGQIEQAQRLINDIEYASFKAKGLCYIARFYSDKDLSRAQAIVAQAWTEVNPHGLPPEYWRTWSLDETVIILAGTLARWDLSEADRIANDWIEKADNRERGQGEIMAAISATDPQVAYRRLIEIIAEGASKGLAGFWQSLAACSEALAKLVGTENIMHLYQHFASIEGHPYLGNRLHRDS